MIHPFRDAVKVAVLFVRLIVIYTLLRIALWLIPDDF